MISPHAPLSLLAAAFILGPRLCLADGAPADLSGYHTTADAITATIHNGTPKHEGQTGYLGVSAIVGRKGRLVVDEVAAGSAAERAGLQKGDVLLSADTAPLKSAGDLRAAMQSKAPGDTTVIEIERGGSKQGISAVLDATSSPVQLASRRAILGVRVGPAGDRPGLDIVFITKDRAAAKAGFRLGDRIMKVDDEELGEAKSLADVMLEKKPGDAVGIVYRRGDKLFKKSVTLDADDSDSTPPEERRELSILKKPVFRLAVICIEFPDAKHNEKVPLSEWEHAFFSRDSYNQKNATGQQVYGSMADYYQEVSCGKIRIEGRVFDWVEATKKRMEYNVSNRSKFKTDFFGEVVQAVLARDGVEALKDFDGIGFIYAGIKPAEVQRSSILWPHRASVKIGDRLWPYVIVPENSAMYRDGPHMSNISTMCHEFGHILGLPDLYARPENPGSEGAGVWTIMSNQIRNGRPQHFCAWCKEQLGWLTPVVIDPTVKQKLILGPVEGSDHECYKVLLRPDGSEYFLLENRRHKGFDASLPAEGLLIWRIVANRPILEESHGVEGPAGPRVFLSAVPWPTKYNRSFTPWTTPSSRSQIGGGLPVNITNIRQLADGRITFEVGQEFE